jgi:Tfp pilus assembly protein FimT
LDIKDRSYRMRIWPACFVGSEAVDWLVSHLRVSRSEALRRGRAMVAVGLIRHVAGEHDFEDGAFFYGLATRLVTSEGAVDAEVVALKKALQSALDFPWHSHTRGLLRHQRCATGSSIVDWIVQQQPISRAKAVLWAAQMMRLAALRHVYDDEPFKDDRSLYRLG